MTSQHADPPSPSSNTLALSQGGAIQASPSPSPSTTPVVPSTSSSLLSEACSDFAPNTWLPHRCQNCFQPKNLHPQFLPPPSPEAKAPMEQSDAESGLQHSASMGDSLDSKPETSPTAIAASLERAKKEHKRKSKSKKNRAHRSSIHKREESGEQPSAEPSSEKPERERKSSSSRIHRKARSSTGQETTGLSAETVIASPPTSPISSPPVTSPVTSPRTSPTTGRRSSVGDSMGTKADEIHVPALLGVSSVASPPMGATSPIPLRPIQRSTSYLRQHSATLPAGINLEFLKTKIKKKPSVLPSSVRKTIDSVRSQQATEEQKEESSGVLETPKEIRNYFENTLCTLLRCMGLSDSSVYSICNFIDGELCKQWSAHGLSPPTSPPCSPRSRRTLLRLPLNSIDPVTRQLLGNIAQDTVDFLDLQAKSDKLIKAQAFVRGWLTRRKFNLTSEQRVVALEKAEIFRELLKTERVYARNLESVIETYLKPLRAINVTQQLMDVQDIVAIFSNIETIAEVHKGVLQSFETLYQKWPLINNIGRVFTEKLIPHLDSYGSYAQNFQSAISTIQMVIAKKPKAWAVVQELRDRVPRDDGLGLHALLALPLSRITKYDNLLELSANYTSADSKEGAELHSAYLTMRQSSEFIGKCLSQGKEMVRLVDLQRRLVFPLNYSYNLIQEGRHFIKEGSITTFKTKKKVNLLMFDDLIIIATANGEKYNVKEIAELSTLQIEEINDPVVKHAFQLVTPNKTHKFQCSTAFERAGWISDITTHTERIKKKDKVFGAPLAVLLQREGSKDGIPIVVERIVRWLTERALDSVGLLRVSGNQKEMELLRLQFDKDPSNVDMSNSAAHDVANLLKLYFMNLPEPLLTFDLYDRFISVIKNKDMDIPTRVDTLRSIIHGGVPPTNLPLIRYMINFFVKIIDHAEQNKMTTKNIAILVAPHFLHAREQTLENSQDIPYINTLVEMLIEHRNEIFSEPQLTGGIKSGRTLYRKTLMGSISSSPSMPLSARRQESDGAS